MGADNIINAYVYELKDSPNGQRQFVDDLLNSRSEAVELFSIAIRTIVGSELSNADFIQEVMRIVLFLETSNCAGMSDTEKALCVFKKLSSCLTRDQLQEYIDIIMATFADML